MAIPFLSDISGKNAIFTGNVTAQGYVQSYGVLYLRNNIQLLNKAGSGWLTLASRDVSGSEAVYNISNVGTLSTSGNASIGGSLSSDTFSVSNASTFSGNLRLQSNIQVLNKAQSSYINIAARDTSGSEVVYNISNLGNVGIGNNDPKAKLHITGADSTASAIRQSRTGVVIWDQAIDSSGRLQWGTRSSEGGTRSVHFTLDDNSKVGVGIGSPDSKLHVEFDPVALTTTNLDNSSVVAASFTIPDATLSGGEGVAIALGMNGRGRSYIATEFDSSNKDATDLVFYNENGGTIYERLRIDQTGYATFAGEISTAGNITMTKSSGNNQLYINSSGGGAPVIYFEDPNRKWGQFVSNGHLYFKDETANITSLKIDGATAAATFAGDVTATSKKFISTSSSSGDYVRLYASSGTAQWDIYGHGENLRFSENSSGGGVVAIDSAVTWSGGGSANANTAYTYSQVTHLPLGGGTMIGNLTFNNPVRSIKWNHSSGQSSSRSWEFIGEQGVYGRFELRRSDAADNTPDTTVLKFDQSDATFTGRVDLQRDLRIRGNDSNPSLGVVRLLSDSNNQLIIDTGNDGANQTIIDGSGNATFAGGVTLKGATRHSHQQFNSDPVSSSDGNNLFTVGGHGMGSGYSRAISLWSTTTGVYRSWVGTNLRWDGTNYKRAVNAQNNNWGNIAGMLFWGNSASSGKAIEFIIDPPENASGGGTDATIGTTLPSGFTALTIDNDLSANFAGTIASKDITVTSSGASTYFGNFLASTGSAYAKFYQDSNNHMSLYMAATGGTANVVLNSNGVSYIKGGNLIVGGSSDSGKKLQVEGTASFAGDITVGPVSNATVEVSETGGADVKMRAGSVGRIGTYSNHEFIVTQNGGDVLKIDTSKISNFTGRVGAAMGASTGAQFPLDVNGVSMLRTEADMWQSEQKFMRIGRYGRGTQNADRQHYLTAKVSDSAANNFISFNIDDGSTSDNSSVATNVLKLSGDNKATFGGDVYIVDNKGLLLGTSGDAFIKHSGASGSFSMYNDIGAMNIVQRQDDGNMVFTNDDGNSGLFDYFVLDGGSATYANGATTAVYTKWKDKSRIALGDGKDLQIYHDGSNSYIQDTSGTGDLIIDTNPFRLRSANGGESMITAFEDGAVNLMHNSFTKLSTTSSGIEVTGAIEASGVVDGPFTALRLANQKTYGSGTGTNETVRFAMGISESGTAVDQREGFVIETFTISETDSSNINTDFKVRDGGTIGTAVRLTGSDKSTTFFGNAQAPKFIAAQGTTYANGYQLTRTGHDTYRICLGNSEGLRIVNETDSNREELAFNGAGNATFSGNITSQAIKVDQTGSDAGLHIGRSDMTSSNFATTNNAIFFGDELPAGSYRHQASISAVREAWSNSPTSLVFKTSATVNSATTALTLDSSQNANFTNNVTITGNLTVGGTTTTLNTQTVEVEDNILQLNTTQGSPDTATASTSGISVYRGNGVTQASFIFDDADDTWDLTNNLNVAGNVLVPTGNVGIGAMPAGGPQAALHVSGSFNTNAPTGNGVFMGLYNSTHGYIQLNGSSGSYIDFSVSGTDHKGRILYDNTSNYMRFDTNGSEKLRIESNGNITLQQKGTIKYEENTDVDSAAAEAIASVVKATHTAAFFDYVIKKGTNVRAGVVVACHDGTNVEYAETSTVDLGDTSDVTLSVDISGTIMRLMATTTSNDWSVKSLIRGI